MKGYQYFGSFKKKIKLWNIVVDILLVPVVLESVVVEKVESSHGNGSELELKVLIFGAWASHTVRITMSNISD